MEKGVFLNVGLSFLFCKSDYLAYDFSYENEIRVGKKLIEFKNEIQSEKDIIEYVELANEYILKYREFQNVRYAKDYIFHLTYSKQNLEGFPKYKEFADIYAVKKFIEESFVLEYL